MCTGYFVTDQGQRDATASADDVVVHLMPHTHWDREWYHPAGRFRQRLVRLVDELLADPPRAGESFLLDGQAIVLDDYLSVRPERAADLSRLLRDGRLEAGPWYVLADELIPSGEALVRNLLAGRAAVRRLGAEPPPVLYCPDSFGHPAALPALAAGFGAALVILWRGYGGPRWPEGDAAWWRAPDGSRALLFHLPPSGYELGSSLPTEPTAARARWEQLRAALAPRSTLGVLLVQNGADHHARQRGHRELLAALRTAASPLPVEPSSLRSFATAVSARAAARQLPEVEGELRDSYGYAWTLQGTFGARAAQKRRNARVERLLTRDAEPWAAIASLRKEGAWGALLHAAWRTLLECHPHDTMCGCSVDAVAVAMDARLADAAVQARGARDDALHAVVGHDPAGAHERPAQWKHAVVVRNAAARPRAGIAELLLRVHVHDVRVGPGSGVTGEEDSEHDAAIARAMQSAVELRDGGEIVPSQLLGMRPVVDLVESPRHYPRAAAVVEVRMLAWMRDVAGYGTRSLALRVAPAPARGPAATAAAPPPATATAEEGTSGTIAIDNGVLRVECVGHALTLIDHAAGSRLDAFVTLEDVDDCGDLYTPSLRGAPRAGRMLSAAVARRGPLRAELETIWTCGDTRSSLWLSLDAGSPFLRVRVRGTNEGTDHRLRIVFRTAPGAAAVWADAAFGARHRVPIVVPDEDRREETPPSTAPMHRCVSLSGDDGGTTIVSDGLAEYEALADGGVAVTLLRAVGELSRNDLPERRGHAGWPRATPLAQSLGPFAAAFAVMPHGARDPRTIASIERCADDFLLPLRGVSLRSALAIPQPTDGVELEGEGLAFSACKPAEEGRAVALRCVNLLETEVRGRWRLGVGVTRARYARLDETPGDALPIARETASASTIDFLAPPRGIVTILVE